MNQIYCLLSASMQLWKLGRYCRTSSSAKWA